MPGELARLTGARISEPGQGRKADADRAATELAHREAGLYRRGGQRRASPRRHAVPTAPPRSFDPAARDRQPGDPPIDRARSDSAAGATGDCHPAPSRAERRRAAAAKALTGLKGAKALPFSPTVFVGFSARGFGGGSDVAAAPVTSLPFGRDQPQFTTLDDREDLDVMAYWTLQNLGVGNKSQIEAARSRLNSADFEILVTLDRVRSEVAGAHARTHARFAQIRSCELAIKAGIQAFRRRHGTHRGAEGLPLEVIDSLRLLARARDQYLNAILDYNQAQFQLYVSLGKPPAELLHAPAPAGRSIVPMSEFSQMIEKHK